MQTTDTTPDQAQQATTTLIHIVGRPGVGKSTLALDIIAGLEKRKKTALSLLEHGLQDSDDAPAPLELRSGMVRLPYERKAKHYDVLILEHQTEPPAGFYLLGGDLVIRMEGAP